MKKIFLLFCALTACLLNTKAYAQTDSSAIFNNLEIAKNEGAVFISLDFNASQLNIRKDEEVVFTPVLYLEENSLELPGIRVSGRIRYYRHLRNNDLDIRSIYRADKNEVVHYQTSVPYEKWMRTAELKLIDSRCGCLSKVKSKHEEVLATLKLEEEPFIPTYVYLPPVIEEKIREASGSAYIDFIVNKTNIDEKYRNNAAELKKIYNTIDSIKGDPDTQILSLTFKGYASPEGSYKSNAKLAKNRTISLKKHVESLYAFPSDITKIDYEAEDWKGLEAFVEKSYLVHKKEILKLIHQKDLDIDVKERTIRQEYPEDYKILLKHCYPALRHSDYTVDYRVKEYTDINEAKEIFRKKPGNLSLHEFYTIAETYEPGSAEYNKVFDTMVRIYPNDTTANLNAANVAMSRGELISAEKFLKKSGSSPEANYARGNLAALQRDFDNARKYFNMALNEGIKDAEKALNQINEIE